MESQGEMEHLAKPLAVHFSSAKALTGLLYLLRLLLSLFRITASALKYIWGGEAREA